MISEGSATNNPACDANVINVNIPSGEGRQTYSRKYGASKKHNGNSNDNVAEQKVSWA